MLPADLLVARVWRGRIYPSFARMRNLEVYVASKVIGIFRDHVGRSRGELVKRLKELEREAFRRGCHYKFVRGLAHLMIRRAVFSKPETKVDPEKARIEVFRAAARFGGYALSEYERMRVLEEVAGNLGVNISELWTAFEAAYEENELLRSFDEMSPEELLREYNLSLAQTVLFKALNVRARVRATGSEVKVILWNVKRLGLMYMARREGEELVLDLDGPANLLRQTERYGTRLAKLLPSLIAVDDWYVGAKIKGKRKTLFFSLSHRTAPPLPRVKLSYEPYDSAVEEDFHKRFLKAGSGWEVKRESEPLVVEGHVLVPDFVFKKMGVKVYMEIVGFWTPGYIKRKMEKLKALRRVNMLVAIDRELACAPEALNLPHEVIVYKNRVPVDAVYRALKRYEPRIREKREEPLKLSREVLEYLSGIREAPLIEVTGKLVEMGVRAEDVARVIAAGGLEVVWRTMDPRDAIVRRRD